MDNLHGFYCFPDKDGKPNKDIIYYFENGREWYYTTILTNHKERTLVKRDWHKDFLNKLINIEV